MFKQLKLFIGLSLICCFTQAETVKIYAAASLTNAVTDIAKRYMQTHPQVQIVPIFAASSTLAKQIEAGAEGDIFFTADQDWAQYLVEKKRIQAKNVHSILQNELVLIAPKLAQVQFKALASFNFAQSFKGHLCTGQMESVPVGKYAKQSLMYLNWVNSLSGRIVGTDDVRSALAFVERGECQVGIVYKTDALLSQKVKIVGTFPAQSHHDIFYSIALTNVGLKNPNASKFYQYIHTHNDAKKIFQGYGFEVVKGTS